MYLINMFLEEILCLGVLVYLVPSVGILTGGQLSKHVWTAQCPQMKASINSERQNKRAYSLYFGLKTCIKTLISLHLQRAKNLYVYGIILDHNREFNLVALYLSVFYQVYLFLNKVLNIWRSEIYCQALILTLTAGEPHSRKLEERGLQKGLPC